LATPATTKDRADSPTARLRQGEPLPAKSGRAVLNRTSRFARDLQENVLLLP
jgi:hypothetical protein